MRIDTHLGGLETAAEVAAAAEASGFDGAFSGEVAADPFLAVAVASRATTRIELGTSIAVAFARSPMAVAYTAWDLQRASQGRFVLGLGSQVKAHVTRRFSMPWGRPAAQMRDFVLALRAVWQSWSGGAPLDYRSEHYEHTLMPPMFVPPGHPYGPPAIYLAGVGDAMTAVAGEVADGFACHGFTTARWIRERTLPALAEGRRRAGATMDGFVVKAAVFLVTGTDEEVAAALPALRARIAFYASTPAYRPVLDLHGWGDLGVALTRLSKEGRWQEMGDLVDDDVLDAFAVVAAPAEVAAVVSSRYGDTLQRISFITDTPQAAVLGALGGRPAEPGRAQPDAGAGSPGMV